MAIAGAGLCVCVCVYPPHLLFTLTLVTRHQKARFDSSISRKACCLQPRPAQTLLGPRPTNTGMRSLRRATLVLLLVTAARRYPVITHSRHTPGNTGNGGGGARTRQQRTQKVSAQARSTQETDGREHVGKSLHQPLGSRGQQPRQPHTPKWTLRDWQDSPGLRSQHSHMEGTFQGGQN